MSLTVPLGHEAVLGRLCDALDRDRLAHALLFTGPEGIGKRLAAHWLAAKVFCVGGAAEPCGACDHCVQVGAQTHPDLSLVDLPAGKKEIGIDLIRRLKRFVLMQAVSGRHKVAVVNDADRLSLAAQNALLKTLEEPAGRALIVLVSATPDGLLPTVRSRCQRVRFQPLTDAQVAAVLVAAGHDPDEARALADRAEGSPGRAARMRALLDAEQWPQLLSLLADLHPARYVSVLSMAHALGRTEPEMAARLEALLSWNRDQAADLVTKNQGSKAAASNVGTDLERLVRRADALNVALKTLRRRNPNRNLLAEALLLRLARI